jgi:hypothetical protein
MLTVEMLALRSHTFSNCRCVDLKVGSHFVASVGKVETQWLYNEVYRCELCIGRESMVIDGDIWIVTYWNRDNANVRIFHVRYRKRNYPNMKYSKTNKTAPTLYNIVTRNSRPKRLKYNSGTKLYMRNGLTDCVQCSTFTWNIQN